MQNASMHVLPVRVKPAVWEDVPSFVRRCSAQMGYERPEWIFLQRKATGAWRRADCQDCGINRIMMYLDVC